MVRSKVITDEVLKSSDLFTLLQKCRGKKVQVAAFDTFYTGKLHNINHKMGQVEIKDGDDIVTLEVERITAFNIL